MSNSQEIEHLKNELDNLSSRKIELSTMCRIEQVAEIKARIRTLRDRLDILNFNGNSDKEAVSA